MIKLDQIKRGRVRLPHFTLLYGVDGVGKTTFGAEAPKPVFICAEQGLGTLDVARFPVPKDLDEVMAMVQLLIDEKHDHETLVVDSLDWLEPIVHATVCKKNNWASVEAPGYGKGYVAAIEEWLKLIRKLKALRAKMNVVLIAHATIRTFTDPEQNVQYDRYQLKLSGQGAKTDASAIWREAVDDVLFANFEIRVTQAGDQRKAKAFGDGERVIYTERRPAFDAKNRNNLPFKLPLSWEEYASACAKGDDGGKEQDLKELLGDRLGEAVAYLTTIGWLKDGQGIGDLSKKRAAQIASRLDNFIASIDENKKGQ